QAEGDPRQPGGDTAIHGLVQRADLFFRTHEAGFFCVCTADMARIAEVRLQYSSVPSVPNDGALTAGARRDAGRNSTVFGTRYRGLKRTREPSFFARPACSASSGGMRGYSPHASQSG